MKTILRKSPFEFSIIYMFTLFVDADSLAQRLRKIILNRAVKENIPTFFIADRGLPDVMEKIEEHTASLRAPMRNTLEKSELRKIRSSISMLVVPTGENSADDKIVSLVAPGDVLISHDVGLCERAIAKGAIAIDDRGAVYTSENIRERVSERDYMKAFREMGINDLKQKGLKEKDYQNFSNSLDKILTGKNKTA